MKKEILNKIREYNTLAGNGDIDPCTFYEEHKEQLNKLSLPPAVTFVVYEYEHGNEYETECSTRQEADEKVKQIQERGNIAEIHLALDADPKDPAGEIYIAEECIYSNGTGFEKQ